MLWRLLRRLVLGSERRLARRGDARSWTPSLGLLRAFEREFGVKESRGAVVFGRLTDPRARQALVGMSKSRLKELHLAASGATGAGKTTWALGFAAAMLRDSKDKLLNLDPKGDTSAAIEALTLEPENSPLRIKDEVKFIRVFDKAVTPPLRLTAREENVAPEVTALGLVTAIEELHDSALGTRMRSILLPLASLAVERELPLSVLVDWLASPRAFADVAAQSQNERLRSYARTQFPRESRESVSAIRSRLETLVLMPSVRRAVEAKTLLPLSEWIERYHLNFDWSSPPAGQEAAVRILASPMIGRIVRAFLHRAVTPSSPHVWLLADELQESLGAFECAGFGRLLALARSRGVSCVLLNQNRGQLPRELQELIATNAGLEAVFRPNIRDAARYRQALPVAEGEANPSRMRDSLLRRLTRLPRRHFLLWVKESPLGGHFVEASEIRIPRLAPGGTRVPSCGEAVTEGKSQVVTRDAMESSAGALERPALFGHSRAPRPGLPSNDFPELG